MPQVSVYRRRYTGNATTDATVGNRDQSQNIDAIKALLAGLFVDAKLLEDIDLTTAPTLVWHQLGRRPRGWMVVRVDAIGLVWDDYTEDSPDDSAAFWLRASADLTVNLVVF